jgi:DNA ligase (NAD+)
MLKKYLEECKEAYYAGKPIISDDQYDNLEELCKEDLGIGTNRGRVKHFYKMYSLQKFYPEDNHLYYQPDYIETPKLDGAAIALRYVNGELDSVVTRGNGEYGEDVSHLFTDDNCTKLGIPTSILQEGLHQITGELVAPIYISNSRNYASGALGLKDPTEFWCKDIAFFAYGIKPCQTLFYQDDLRYLKFYFYNVVNHSDDSSYPKDGAVFRIDDNKEYEKAGFTSKHPRGAFALKVRSEGVKTTILDVVWDVGKSGKVTPVALLEPINIDGATVSRATLNNPGFIEALGVEIGDKVFVERAGGIIPRIIRKAE